MVALSKVRIYELAKETGLSNKEVLDRVSELGIEAKSHSSSVSEGDALRFRESLGKAAAEKEAAEKERQRREAEEYERAMTEAKPKERTASRILPPHLRKAAQSEETSESAAAPAARMRPPAQPFRPADSGSTSVGGQPAPAAAGSTWKTDQSPIILLPVVRSSSWCSW